MNCSVTEWRPSKTKKLSGPLLHSILVGLGSTVLAEVAETRGKRSEDLERLKVKLLEQILLVIDQFIAQERIDVAEGTLAKTDQLNMKYGHEYNSFTVRIHEKRAMCLKYNCCTHTELLAG